MCVLLLKNLILRKKANSKTAVIEVSLKAVWYLEVCITEAMEFAKVTRAERDNLANLKAAAVELDGASVIGARRDENQLAAAERQLAQIAQRGKTGPEIVQAEPYTEFANLLNTPQAGLALLQQGAFGYFENQQ